MSRAMPAWPWSVIWTRTAPWRWRERYFESLPGGAAAIRPWAPPVVLESDLALRFHDHVELDRIYEVWHSTPQFHADDAALSLLADVLGRGRASRLYRKLVVEENLAQAVVVHQAGREMHGTFVVIVTLRPGQSWQRARGLIQDEVQAIAGAGVERRTSGTASRTGGSPVSCTPSIMSAGSAAWPTGSMRTTSTRAIPGGS